MPAFSARCLATAACVLAFCPALSALAQDPAAASSVDAPEPMVVTGQRPALQTDSASLGEIDRTAIARLRPIHPSELRVGAPGLWVSRGSGQEHLMALRSPVLTGAGACGAFAYLENGLPVRPVGLCNINQLIELNLEQADSVRVFRGPAPLVPGAGGLHGVLDARSGLASAQAIDWLAGPDDFQRLAFDVGTQRNDYALRLRSVLAHDGGFRATSGYDQGKLNLDVARPWNRGSVSAHVALAGLQQETAGFVRGFNAYRDIDVARSNPNPEAFRDAWALRVTGQYLVDRLAVQPFYRRSQMTFLQHFLPGQPLERNAQSSGGVALARHADAQGLGLEWRALIEAADMSLLEDQADAISFGSAFLRATRPAGRHYDIGVRSLAATLSARWTHALSKRQRLALGLRADRVRYRYRNGLPDGNTDDQGRECDFGGCLFTRPASRSDTFFEVAPSLRWTRQLGTASALSVGIERGVRMPQITELYRLQSGQSVADLSPETLDSVDVGLTHRARHGQVRAVVFASVKRDGIFRDADGFNVSRSETSHAGVEVDARYALHPNVTLSASFTLAQHRYRFDRLAPGAEPIRRNDDVDTAPRALGNVALTLTPSRHLRWHIEAEHMGGYWLDAANAHRYTGHDLLHTTLDVFAGPWTVGLKIRNVMDEPFAERADFAFGQYRYFPGQPRSVFVSVRRALDGAGS